MASTTKHPIGVVSRRTGLKADLIRAWERRYGAVNPDRTETHRRLYSESDIERLKLLRQAVNGGRGIRHVANLPRKELLELIAADTPSIRQPPGPELKPKQIKVATGQDLDRLAETSVASCLEAVRQLDGRELDRCLERASVSLSRMALFEKVVVPLMHTIGDLWRAGDLRPAHEHLAVATVRAFVSRLPSRRPSHGAPRLIVTAPAGQHHELGALLVAESAQEEGWQVTYLGTDLAAEEIAAVGRQGNVRAVALSITYPPDDPRLPGELSKLRQVLPKKVEILVGGRSAGAYSDALDEVGAHQVTSWKSLRHKLEDLRAAS